MNKDIILGFIESNNKKYDFVLDNFKLFFVGFDYNQPLFGDDVKIIPDENGFIHGFSFNRNRISIYVGKNPFNINNTIKTWLYIDNENIVRNNLCDQYNAIVFKGGSIDSIWKNYGLSVNNDNKIKIRNNSVTYQICMNGEECDLHEYSTVREQIADYKKSISDDDATIKIVFPNNKVLGDFENYYTKIEHVVSFLIFRRNVGFNKVILGKQQNDNDFEPLAECHIDYRYKSVVRNTHRCITLDRFDGQKIRQLFNIVQEKSGLPVECIPKNRNDFGWTNKDKVRDLCTALEIEIDKQKICATANKQLEDLINEVECFVKSYRENHKEISQRTYDSIFNSIDRWNNSLYDRIIAALDKSKNEIDVLKKYYGIELCDEDIVEFVKYRNSITHEKGKILDVGIANTTLVLTVLLYFMILQRIGFKEEDIISFVNSGLISHIDN